MIQRLNAKCFQFLKLKNRYFEDEDGEPGLDNIETQEEFDMVSEVFDSIVEDGEYDEIIEE